MSLDIQSHFNKIKSDPKWLTKFAIGGSFYFIVSFFQFLNNLFSEGLKYTTRTGATDVNIPLLIIYMLFSLISIVGILLVSAIPGGYIIKYVHQDLKSNDNLLPEWSGNFISYMKKGLIFMLINIIYSVAIAVICAIPGIITFFVYLTHKNSPVIINISTGILVTFVILLTIFYSFISPFIKILYAENYNFYDSFNFGKILNIIKTRFSEYLNVILKLLLFFIACFIGIILLTCTCVGILLIPFLALPISLVIMSLFTEIYKNYKSESKISIDNI